MTALSSARESESFRQTFVGRRPDEKLKLKLKLTLSDTANHYCHGSCSLEKKRLGDA